MYMLDTNILVEFLRGNSPAILKMLQKTDARLFKVPSVVKAELLLGAAKSRNTLRERKRVEELLFPFEIVPFDDACAYHYANVRARLEKDGARIGANDLLIAATALARSSVLVTNNVNEFQRVPGLAIEAWSEEAI